MIDGGGNSIPGDSSRGCVAGNRPRHPSDGPVPSKKVNRPSQILSLSAAIMIALCVSACGIIEEIAENPRDDDAPSPSEPSIPDDVVDPPADDPAELPCSPKTLGCSEGMLASLVCTEAGAQIAQEPCEQGSACSDDLGECIPWMCEPLGNVCVDGEVRTCAPDGLGYLSSARPCTNDEVCFAGTCQELLCSRDSCAGETLLACEDEGSLLREEPCNEAEHCLETEHGASCEADVCVPDDFICGEKRQKLVCNDAGSGRDIVDCGAGSYECSSRYGCGFTTRHETNSHEWFNTRLSKLQLMQATRDGAVVGIEAHVDSWLEYPVTFLVYEGEDEKPLDLIWSRVVEKPAVETYYTHSEPFSVPVVAGRFYAVGYSRLMFSGAYEYVGYTVEEAGPFKLIAGIAHFPDAGSIEEITGFHRRHNGMGWGFNIYYE